MNSPNENAPSPISDDSSIQPQSPVSPQQDSFSSSEGKGATGKRKPSRRASTAERRATHNAVERARRETLNGRFLDLAGLLPNLSQLRRPSKSSIVNSSIAHIHAARRHRLLASRELRLLKLESDALRRELNEWRNRSGIPRIDEPVRGEGFSVVLSGEPEIIPIPGGAGMNEDGEDEFGGSDDFDGASDEREREFHRPTTATAAASIPDDEARVAAILKSHAQVQVQSHRGISINTNLNPAHGHGHPSSMPMPIMRSSHPRMHTINSPGASGPMIASPTSIPENPFIGMQGQGVGGGRYEYDGMHEYEHPYPDAAAAYPGSGSYGSGHAGGAMMGGGYNGGISNGAGGDTGYMKDQAYLKSLALGGGGARGNMGSRGAMGSRASMGRARSASTSTNTSGSSGGSGTPPLGGYFEQGYVNGQHGMGMVSPGMGGMGNGMMMNNMGMGMNGMNGMNVNGMNMGGGSMMM